MNGPMKVNTALLLAEEQEQQAVSTVDEEPVGSLMEVEEDEDDDEDESGKHSKWKTLLLIAAMAGGFVLCVWNFTAIANNARLDNQGHAIAIVSEMEDLDSFMDRDEGSGSTIPDKDVIMESEVSIDAARDGPSSGDSYTSSIDEDDIEAIRKQAQDALNEAALVRQELKNAEDMLDSSLAREAELQNRIDELTGN